MVGFVMEGHILMCKGYKGGGGAGGAGGGGGGPSISFPQNYISEMDTFSCINSQFMDDAWSLKSLRPGLQMLL